MRKRARESSAATHEIFLSVETASTLLYAQETTTAQLRSRSCFPADRLVKIEYFQTIRKKDFAEILENFLPAGHLVFLRPFPAAGHIATAFLLSLSGHI